ncbi:MAG: DUF2288 family protein [Bdellovibrionales bacterium]|nr:DUF2288 family protein [Bdellovibrionales bacterium]
MSLIAQLKKEINKADWEMLKPHADRDAIIVVDQELELADVAAAVVKDDSDTVKNWMDLKKVGKPLAEQLTEWGNNPNKSFIFIIVQPYVLVQEMAN